MEWDYCIRMSMGIEMGWEWVWLVLTGSQIFIKSQITVIAVL